MMTRRNVRVALALLTVCAPSATRAEAACCGMKNWFRAPAPTTTFYAPFTAAYAPAGCGQVVNYMPQTCFRTVYVNTPVTTFRPEPACGPCGTPTTVMRPVVSYVMRPQLVPYTTFRPVVTAAPVVAAYAPAPVAVPVAPAAPCCGGGAAVAPAPLAMPTGAVPMPAAPVAMPGAPMPMPAAPMGASPMPMGAPGATVPSLAPMPEYSVPASANTVPSLAAPPAGAAPPSADPTPNRTFDNSAPTETNKPADPSAPVDNGTPADPSKPVPQSRLLLPPAPAAQNTNRGALHGLDPEDPDRVTAVPLRPDFAVRPASLITRAPAAVKPQAAAPPQASDWRAARR